MPNSKGSVGKNILKPNPCTNSDKGSESGVKNTTRYRQFVQGKNSKQCNGQAPIGKTLMIIECFFTKKKAFSKINSAENQVKKGDFYPGLIHGLCFFLIFENQND